MTDFTLDTAGTIWVSGYPTADKDQGFGWSDLSPFEQGYVEALFASLRDRWLDLSPEALALILRDCEAFARCVGFTPKADDGRHFWDFRQRGEEPGFPPLTPYLSDDGKVCLRKTGGQRD